jgi:hypothetical protein
MKNFITCTCHQILFGSSNQEGWDGMGWAGQGMYHAYKVLLENLKGRDLAVDGRTILEWILE